MKVIIPQLNLAALIERGAAAAAKNSPVHILNFVRLVASGGNLALASTDHDRFAEATGAATIEAEGAICVDKIAFDTLVRKHPKSGSISLEVADGRLIVTCGRSRVKLPTLSADTFPHWAEQPADAAFAMPGADFCRMIERVRFAASTNEAQYYLQGVLFDVHDGSLHFVATDGHRLAICGTAAPEGAEECPKIIVPSEAVDATLRVFKGAAEISIEVNKRAISFAADGLRLAARLIDGNFPDYARVIPERGDNPTLTFNRSTFVDCLDRANVLAGDGAYSAIAARPDGDTLRLESRNQSGGEATEEMSAVIAEGFKAFGFNARYAAQFIATLNVAELTVEQSDPNGPHLILSADAPDFLGVLMPVRISA